MPFDFNAIISKLQQPSMRSQQIINTTYTAYLTDNTELYNVYVVSIIHVSSSSIGNVCFHSSAVVSPADYSKYKHVICF
jgi:hypothetical protein